MKTRYVVALAIAAALTGAARVAITANVAQSGAQVVAANPCAANPCAADNPCAANPCAGV